MAKALEKDKTRRYASAGDLAVGHPALPAGRSDPGPACLGALSASQVRPAAQGAGGRGVGHLRGAPGGNRSFRSSLPCVRPKTLEWRMKTLGWRMRTPAWRTSGSVPPRYQSYRARIAAAIAALSHHDVADAARPARRSPGGFARLGMAPPAHPARRQHVRVPVTSPENPSS